MLNLASLFSTPSPSRSAPFAPFAPSGPLKLVLASTLVLFLSACGGGYVAGFAGTCYPYGCGGYPYGGPYYGYGYGPMSTAAGTGAPGSSGNGAKAVKAELTQPVAVAVDASGNLYIADRASNTVREVAASTGVISNALSGSAPGIAGRSVSASGSAAAGPGLSHPSAVALDPTGNIYVLDQASSTVSRFSPSTGSLTIVAGSPAGLSGYSGDNGKATGAQLNLPSGMAFDSLGNLYIADTANNRIREVAASTGVITRVAGNGTAGYSGDAGPAAAAQVSRPAAVATDSKGNVFIADTGNAVIRKLDVTTGNISTVAGDGILGFAGDNAAATSAQLNEPKGIAVDPHGDLFVADSGNQRIREVNARTGVISTIAGDQTQGYAGDGGPSSRAELNNPSATAIDASGNLYIADAGNGVVRKVLPDPQTVAKAN